jgi:hypothetical protein
VNIAQQDRIAQRDHECPRCEAEPGKRCWEWSRRFPGRKVLLAWPHAERSELVPADEEGLALTVEVVGARGGR